MDTTVIRCAVNTPNNDNIQETKPDFIMCSIFIVPQAASERKQDAVQKVPKIHLGAYPSEIPGSNSYLYLVPNRLVSNRLIRTSKLGLSLRALTRL